MIARDKLKIKFIGIILLSLFCVLIAYPRVVYFWPKGHDLLNRLKVNLGLDLQGGIHLEYQAELANIAGDKKDEAMQAIQDVIERRINAFGVAEPVIYTAKSGTESRLVVELAGIKDIDQAKKMIKETPLLEFKEIGPEDESKKIPQEALDKLNEEAKKKAQDLLDQIKKGVEFAQLAKDNSEDPGSKDNGGDLDFVKKGALVPEFDKVLFESELKNGEVNQELIETQFGWHIIKKLEERGEGDNREVKAAHILIAKKANPAPQQNFTDTGLTGKNLKSAAIEYQSQGLAEPQVALKFDDEGAKLFADITKRNVGKQVAIYLDNEVISAPTVQTEITNGEAVITGNFSAEEAKQLVRRLNEGALPVPISLVSQQSVEASLGDASLKSSLKAGVIGLIIVIFFMLIYYRFLGLIASLSLLIYTGLMLTIIKLSAFSPWQITLTLPGIAAFIISIGMAVDANILIFERTKEEIRRGRGAIGAIEEGFRRAWTSIRDGNVSSIITAMILVLMGTGFVKGFAITLILGVLISMFTAVVITRTMLRFLVGEWIEDKLWLIGVRKTKEGKPNNQ